MSYSAKLRIHSLAIAVICLRSTQLVYADEVNIQERDNLQIDVKDAIVLG